MVSSNNVTITEQGHLVVGNVGIPAAVVPAIEAYYRAKFAAERMPEDVQKLVAEIGALKGVGLPDGVWRMLDEAADALEAAYSEAEPEPEWEYGYTSKWGNQVCPSLSLAQYMADALRSRIAAGKESGDLDYHGHVVRRVPAQLPGDWERFERGVER